MPAAGAATPEFLRVVDITGALALAMPGCGVREYFKFYQGFDSGYLRVIVTAPSFRRCPSRQVLLKQ
jgi:hypothetical protein